MRFFFIIVIASSCARVYGTNYYLSNNGNDLQRGTTVGAPWQSLIKLSEVLPLLKPGDSILLQRGSVFAGQLNISVSGKLGQDVYVGAYGTGANPVIKGTIEIKNWILLR